ncbi:MAG: aspartate kinase, partial [Proteobacteria bacterium]|nr:aspartate kinase [Pseudomonadota bacterium]
MSWVVLKFGGTSVSSVQNWRTIARVIQRRLDEGVAPVVVCSAFSQVSNLLEQLLAAALRNDFDQLLEQIRDRHQEMAKTLDVDSELIADNLATLTRLVHGAALVGEVTPRLHAMVMAQGELMATTLGAAFLNKVGIATSWVDARQVLTAIDEPLTTSARSYLSATCSADADAQLQHHLQSRGVILTQGFIASNSLGETVLLGRGGSDTTAAYFAARLGASRCEIWTDVPGLYTANPLLIPTSRLLLHLDYDEAQEIASTGATVLHPRCIPPLRHSQIPLFVRCTQHADIEGTTISGTATDHNPLVKSVSSKSGITLISMNTDGMWQQVGFLSDVFAVFKARGFSIDLVSTSEMNVTVSLDPASNALNPKEVELLLQALAPYCTARAIGPCATVSLVGSRIRALLHQLGPALEVFEEQPIHLVSQAASDLNLTFVVDANQAQRLVRKLHSMLFSQTGEETWLGPTWQERFGLPEAPAQPTEQWWSKKRQTLLKITESEGSPLYVYDESSLDEAAGELANLNGVDRVFFAIKANSHADILRCFYQHHLGFECVSPQEMHHVL